MLVDRRGGVRRKAVNKVIDAIRRAQQDGTLPADEAQYTIDEIRRYIYLDRAGKKNRQLRESGLFGHLEETEIQRMFTNAGSNLTDEANYLGVNPDELADLNNWSNDIYTDPSSGRSWRYTFGYGGFAQWEAI